jgi:MFS superfamily sulfate permease-like transporter
MSAETKSERTGIVPNIISGLATGLFSIPEGMAYAQLAGVNPIYGLYSGIVAVIVSSLGTGTHGRTRTCDHQERTGCSASVVGKHVKEGQ